MQMYSRNLRAIKPHVQYAEVALSTDVDGLHTPTPLIIRDFEFFQLQK